MEFISTLTGSQVLMGIVAFVFAIICIRCLIYGVLGGTSVMLRIVCTVVFGFLAYYFWQLASSANDPNIIDNFVFDAWTDLKGLVSGIKNKI